jgi:hypothetical protein
VDSKKGQHLGHVPGGTQKNSLWVNDATGRVKLGCHLRFDEGMNDLTLAELPPNMKTLLHSGEAPSMEDIIAGEDSDVMMFHSPDCPFKSKRTFTVNISCRHPTFGIVIKMDKLFHEPWVGNVLKSKKTDIHSISSGPKTAGQNIRGACTVAINDVAIFSEANALDVFATVQKSKDKTFKLVVGCLDKMSAQEAQREQDELLLHPEKCTLIAESKVEPIGDNDTPPPSTGPVAPSPYYKRNISVPTPGIRRSISSCFQAKEKETVNLTVQSIVIEPHCLTGVDPFDKLLDNHNHIGGVLSDPEVVSVIQNHLMAITGVARLDAGDTDGLHASALQSKLVTPEELALGLLAR